MTASGELLRDYAERDDQGAFGELIARYIDLVYSTAVRRVGGDADLARDVTQTVFADLARKARSLRGEVMLGGWLHRHTGFVSASLVRGERRRQARERQAAEMNTLHDSPDPAWQQLAPAHRLEETADGALVAEDLTAGSYLLKVGIGGSPGSDGQRKTLLQAEAPFTVPAEPSSGTLDLGDIVLQPVH